MTDSNTSKSGRLSSILDLLAQRGRLSVAEASRALGVSEATVRRDFSELGSRQLATRNHGGIVASSVAYELPYRYRRGQGDEALARIGTRAAAMVNAGEVIVLNGGTTTTATARALTEREDLAAQGGQLTLVTNALNIASEAVLRSHVQCVSLGGVARPESYEVSGPLASLVCSQLWFDTAIIGVNAISSEGGATCRFEDEAATVRLMVERSDRTIVVCAEQKLGKRTFAEIAPVEALSALVTDAPQQHPEVRALRARGVAVFCV